MPMTSRTIGQWWIAVEFGKWGFVVFLDGRTNRWRQNDGTRLSFGVMIGKANGLAEQRADNAAWKPR